MAVGKFHAQLRDQRQGPLIVGRLAQPEMAPIPAVSQQDGEGIILRKQACHIIGAILEMLGIVIEKRREKIIPRFSPVEICFKKPQAADIQTGGAGFLRQRKSLLKLRMGIPVLYAKPLTDPRIVQFPCFKKARLRHGFLAVIAADSDGVPVAGIGLQGEIQGFSQGIQFPLLLKDDLLQRFIQSHRDTGRLLPGAGVSANLPGALGNAVVKAHGIFPAIDLDCVQFHRTILSCRRCISPAAESAVSRSPEGLPPADCRPGWRQIMYLHQNLFPA